MYSAIWSPPLDGVNPVKRFEMFRKSTSGRSPDTSSRIAWYDAGESSDVICEPDGAGTSVANMMNVAMTSTRFTGASTALGVESTVLFLAQLVVCGGEHGRQGDLRCGRHEILESAQYVEPG